MKIAISLTLVILLTGCDSIFDAILENNKDSFKAAYKESFIESCLNNEENEEKEKFCTCLADHLTEKFTVKELRDEEATIKYIEEYGIPLCHPQRSSKA